MILQTDNNTHSSTATSPLFNVAVRLRQND